MKLSKVVQFCSILTVLAIIYIHMQMQIFDLAYQGKVKEKKIVALAEGNDRVAYNISRLKSADYLGGNLLAKEKDLRFQDNKSTVQLVSVLPIDIEQEPAVQEKQKANSILRFLSSQAEARAAQKKSIKPWLQDRF